MASLHGTAGLSRRGFLGLLATGAVGACVAAQVPTGWLPEPVRRRAACEFLRREHNAWVTAHRGEGLVFPRRMTAGRELFEAYEGELLANERFCSTDDLRAGITSLKFKGTNLYSVGRGWRVACHGDG